MTKNYRINLLIPYLDGEYYGAIFTTLHEEAMRRQSSLFSIQAVATVENPTTFNYEIGTEGADGWLLMTNPHSMLPASTKFLETLQASGKPVVTIGYEEDTIPCYSVMIDNRQAIKDVVYHLIEMHGHRKIAFVGGTEHIDLIERFEGYKEALQECGISFDESLYFQASDSLRQGGELAAQKMLERGIDFTAVVAATDLNAMGLIDRLQSAGYRIPEQIAVIGFDDLPISTTFNPPLTSVYQPITDLARAGIDLLYRLMDGEHVDDKVSYIPTQFFARSSCGCTYEAVSEPPEVMRKKLLRAEGTIDHLIRSHNQLARNWVSAAREEYFDFSKMFEGISHWGCLALWDTDNNDHKHLIVKQAFGKQGDPVPPIGLKVPIKQFPPIDWLPNIGDNEFVRIQSIRNDREDLGFIVLVGEIDKLVLISEVDVTRISCNISVTALVRDQLFNQVRSIAEQLEIVSQTTNDGIWDWDIKTNKIQWSTRAHDMINSIGGTLTHEPESLYRLIHPDDYEEVITGINNHLIHDQPIKLEFRIQNSNNGKLLWLFAAGDSIRDENGEKIRMIGSITNISEKKIAEKQITHLAFHDVLTGLPNRQMIRDQFQRSKAIAERDGHKLGIMLIDLDRFKIINDTLGHHMGDQLLREVAKMLDQLVRMANPAGDHQQESIVARLGGDEFIVLLNGIRDVAQLQEIADQMVDRFQAPFKVERLELFTTASIGISVFPDDGQDLDALTRCADIAMYKAKETGKNRSVMYDHNQNSLTYERLTMENELRRALEREEFELHYQPQINLETNEISGIEALIRWRSAERGLVSPAEFIPLTEDSGIIIPIGKWVLKEACQQKKKWIEEGLPPTVISVNISANQLLQNDFVDMVKATLEETGLDPEHLCLEITESTAIMNWSNSIDKLQALRQLGVHIAIDDFGTGYSSLLMLKHLPITKVKIDSSFVRDMVVNPEDAAIATAIISLARKLGFIVIAEGVETEDQRRLLTKERCHSIQGYIVSKPLQAEECLTFMNNYRLLHLQ